MLYLIAKYKLEDFIFILLFLFLLLPSTISSFLLDQKSPLFSNLTIIIKILTFPITLLSLKFLSSDVWKKLRFKKFISAIVYIISIAVIMSIFGFGKNTYSYGVGFKGYFISGNELSALWLLVISYYVFYLFTEEKRNILLILKIILIVVVGGLIATKTAILGSILSLFIIPVLLKVYKSNWLYIKKRNLLIIIFLGIILLTLFIYFLQTGDIIEYSREIANQIKDAGNITTYLLSNRNVRMQDNINVLKSNSVIDFLFGYSWFGSLELLKTYNEWGHTEIDFFDLFSSYGLLGIILIYGFWLKVLIFEIREFFKKQNEICIPILFSISLLVIISFMSGHIMYSAMVGFYLGVSVQYSRATTKDIRKG